MGKIFTKPQVYFSRAFVSPEDLKNFDKWQILTFKFKNKLKAK